MPALRVARNGTLRGKWDRFPMTTRTARIRPEHSSIACRLSRSASTRIYNQALPERDRKPACVLACPTSARLFGDIHDPASEVSTAIRESGGYALMPEWGTQPANHYLPRRKTEFKIRPEDLRRHDNPL